MLGWTRRRAADPPKTKRAIARTVCPHRPIASANTNAEIACQVESERPLQLHPLPSALLREGLSEYPSVAEEVVVNAAKIDVGQISGIQIGAQPRNDHELCGRSNSQG